MLRRCDSCGVEYAAKRAASRFCSPRCRQRARRSSSPVALPVPSLARPVSSPSVLVESVRRELAAAGRDDSWLGQQALALAAKIDAGQDTGSGIASLSKELRSVMGAALEGVAQAADPLDELRARRDVKRSVAG